MKKIKTLIVFALLAVSLKTIAQTPPNLTGFIMWWMFCNADGSNERDYENVCKGGKFYIKNLSNYDGGSIGSALTTGTYVVKRYLNPTDFQLATIQATAWPANGVIEITLPGNLDFTVGPSNLRITHYGPGVLAYSVSDPFYNLASSRHRTNHLVTHSVSANAGPDVSVCPFQSVTLSGTITTGASPLWQPSGSPFSNLTIFPGASTIYTLTATKNFTGYYGNTITCKASDQVTVNVKPAPSLHLVNYSLCTSDPMPVLNAGSTPVSYQWTFIPYGTTTIMSAGFGQYVNTALYGYGTYNVTVYGANGCSSTGSSQVLLDNSAAVNVNAAFTTTNVNSLSSTTISASSTETGSHWWGIFSSDETCTHGLYPIQPPYTGGPNVTFGSVPLNQHYVVLHKVKKSPCNEWSWYERCLFHTQKIIASVSPNPAADFVTVLIENYDELKTYSVSIYDRNGALVENFGMRTSSRLIDISTYQSDFYTIQITDGISSESIRFIKS